MLSCQLRRKISKLFNFFISSSSHPGKINMKNAWTVENLNLPSAIKLTEPKLKTHLQGRKFRLLQYERHYWSGYGNYAYRSKN